MDATFHILLRIWRLRPLLACISGLFVGDVHAQTNPSVQDLPYNQNFGSVAHNSTSYPTGWQGWRITNVPSAVFETTPAIGDLSLLANSTAATNTGGVHNYNGTIGLLNSGSVNGALALGINTTRRATIVVNYELATIRDPYNGGTNTRINEATLQFRVGTIGDFTTVSGPTYTTGTATQTGPVTTPIGVTSFSVTLPGICDDQPIVQLRWVTRDVTGSGSRPSIALDQVNISGTCTSATLEYAGSPYCSNEGTAFPTVLGAAGGTFSATGMTIIPSTGAITLSSSSSGTVHYQLTAENGCSAINATAPVQINQSVAADAGGPYHSIEAAPVSIGATANGTGSWSGGNGVFANANDPITTYTPALTERGFTIELTWVTDDPDGAGPCSSVQDIANLDVDFLVYTPMFSGGIGRGDGHSALNYPDTYAYMFTGGNGRGDAFSTGPGIAELEFMFVGGIGRGDASVSYLAPAGNSAIFHGGQGRGDVSNAYNAPPPTANIFLGGSGRGDVSHGYAAPPALASTFLGGQGRGDVMSTYLLPSRVQLALKAFLQGPYDAVAGRMRDDLRAAGLLPTTEPYSDLGYDFVQGGGESASTLVFSNGPQPKDRIVDWVLLELRDATDPTVVMSSRSALIQRDGDVVDLDGASPVSLVADPAAYHVVLRHRNHLGVMTWANNALGPLLVGIDLTDGNTATYGSEAQVTVGGVKLLWAGDVTFDGSVKYTGEANDRDPILFAIGGVVPTNTLDDAYTNEDVNMDGRVMYTGEGNDRDIILQNIGGVIPTTVREGQTP
ncbi:MAG: hypothetical protein H6590_05540 [Flavobacteriales bacterium]|nr:hypothetical protein [Flavobacteriales bacterium]